MSNSSVLTRFLYWKDEVELSLIISLLKSEDFTEVLFWLYELYFTGYKEYCFKLAFKIYYDFYAHLNPKLDDFICNNYEKWKQSDDDFIIGYIFRNMFCKRYTFNVFHLRQLLNNPDVLPSVVFRGRSQNWISKYPKRFKNLLMSIHKNKFVNIAYYLKQVLDNDLKECYENVVMYFKNEKKVEIKEDIFKEILDEFNTLMYSDKKHYILSIIMYLKESEENVNLRKIFITLTKEDREFVIKIENEKITPDWKTLCFKRCYPINSLLGCFNLERDKFENIEHEMWFHWEYYASFSPLWNKRMFEFNYKRNKDTKTIEFANDDIMENFYQKYGFLEPDEQPKYIQDASTGNIIKKNWKYLYDELNKPETVLNFTCDFRYKY